MLQPGFVLGNYRVDGLLGNGGMGVVYEATQLSLQRTVALKVIGADISADAAFRERFRLEGLIQAGLDHPHIVTVFEAGEHDRHLFIAMRLVRGPTLKDLIIGRELDAGRALRVLAPIADALDTAHAAGLIHRDVKPQNILVGPRDHAYLADFGLTKSPGQRGLTRTGQFVGSIDYIAPEQINGGVASPRTDVYALGAVLFEALTGVVPYPKDSDAAVLYAHMTEAPPRISEQRPELPPALDAVIAAAMAKEPADRHASAVILLRAAERAFSRPTRAAMRMPGPFEHPEEAGVRAPEARVSTVESPRNPPAAPGVPAGPAGPGLSSTPGVPAAPGASATTGLPAEAAGPAHHVPPARSARPPSAAPAGPAPARRRRRAAVRHETGAVRIGAAALLAILAAAGFAAGRTRASSDDSVAPRQTATALGVGLELPAGWSEDLVTPSLPGLQFGKAISAVASPPSAGGLVAGIVDDGLGHDLLPASLSHELTGAATIGAPVHLATLEALRYAQLHVAGSTRVMTLYAVSTTRGAAVVACYAPADQPSAAVLDACAGAATTLDVTPTVRDRGESDSTAAAFQRTGRAYPLAPDRGYARGIAAALRALDRARGRLRAQLAAATSRSAQASAATQLARVTGAAERSAAAVVSTARDREANGELLDALGASRMGYEDLAAAALAGSSRSYALAEAAIDNADAETSAALGALATLGYVS